MAKNGSIGTIYTRTSDSTTWVKLDGQGNTDWSSVSSGDEISIEHFRNSIGQYQQRMLIKRQPKLEKLSADVMAHCMKAADEGKPQQYTPEMSAAWSAQLRKLIKQKEELAKADAIVYVQPEYESWE